MFHSKALLHRCLLGTSLIAGLLISGCNHDSKDSAAEKVSRQLQTVLDTAVAKPETGYPGAILYARSADGVWQNSAGIGEINTQTAMNPDDKFRAGSMLKMLVSAVTLQLIEEGKLSLDATVPTVLPVNIAETLHNNEQITVQMLLNHTSGIPEPLNDAAFEQVATNPANIWAVGEWINLAATQNPLFAPGEGWSYSNANYLLLGMIIEQATGNTWRSEVRRRVIDRLALTNTFLPEPGDLSIPGNYAHGYIEGMDVTGIDPSMMDAAGGSALVTTASDLVRFLDAFLSGDLFQHSDTVNTLMSFVEAQDETGLPASYGLGLQHYVYAASEMMGHTGGTAGFAGCVFVFPAENITIAAMVNASEMESLFLDIVIPVFETLKEPAPTNGGNQ